MPVSRPPLSSRWHTRFPIALIVWALAAAGCTSNGGAPSPSPAPGSPTATSRLIPSPSAVPTRSPITLPVVADLRSGASSRPYLDGMQLAVDEINELGGVDGHPLAVSVRDHGGD